MSGAEGTSAVVLYMSLLCGMCSLYLESMVVKEVITLLY